MLHGVSTQRHQVDCNGLTTASKQCIITVQHVLHTLSLSATKYMLLSVVLISNANGLLMASSAPLIDRHLLTYITPVLHANCAEQLSIFHEAMQNSHLYNTAWNRILQQTAVSAYTTRLDRACKITAPTGVMTSDLNQNILPCLSTKYLQAAAAPAVDLYG